MSIEIPKNLEKEIKDFAKLNDVQDIDDFVIECLRDGFNIAKYGYSPIDNFKKENKPFKNEEYVEEKIESKRKIERIEETPIERTERQEEVKPKKKIRIINN
jgi:hypothetical protein